MQSILFKNFFTLNNFNLNWTQTFFLNQLSVFFFVFTNIDCENLLKRFLVLNPMKRSRLEVSICLFHKFKKSKIFVMMKGSQN